MRVLRFVLPVVLAAAPLAPNPATAQVAIGLSVTIAPPALPVYEQPLIPGPGYIWTPGYWAWGDNGYFWVPGTWMRPPAVGLLWTPGYWAWSAGSYIWNAGYWGPHIGFYGGINYGFGYFGHGFDGGYWNNGAFYYNRSVNNIRNVNITNVYNRTIINNTTINRVSYNGSNGGIATQPSAQELAVAHEQHIPATAPQIQHVDAARANPALRAAENHGAPPVAATRTPGQFTGPGAVPARAPASGTVPPSRPASPPDAQATRAQAVPRPPNQQQADHPSLPPRQAIAASAQHTALAQPHPSAARPPVAHPPAPHPQTAAHSAPRQPDRNF